jgi:transposition helper protein
VARYGKAFKDRAVARLLPPESAPVEVVSQELHISVATLERWRADALAAPAAERVWTPAARIDAIIATASMDEASRNAWCREKGIYPQDLQKWRDAATQGVADPEEASQKVQRATQASRRRVKELERDLRRKEKALAETTALLVLRKKLDAIFHPDEGEDT